MNAHCPQIAATLLSSGCARARRGALALGMLAFFALGCGKGGSPEVTVYTALDQEFSHSIFDEFTRETGILVRPKYDTESTKTVGLVQAILAERDRPRCDVFWNNEILNTLRLEKYGLLAPYRAASAAGLPEHAQSATGLWHGFAARARVLIVNTNQLSPERWPKSIRDLADPQWYERCAIAKPLFGTTATHAACLFAAWGDEDAKAFFLSVKRNAQIKSGNKQVALSVGNGAVAFGLTDTDDAIAEVAAGKPVAIIYPDQRENEMGTLFIPNTLALIDGAPNPEPARKLLEYLLSPQVERRLAEGPSAQIPLRAEVPASDRVKTPQDVKAMHVDWAAAAEKWSDAADFLAAEFTAE